MKNISTKLLNKLNQIPEFPGIYKMLDSKGNIIYIGKSKCLKKRVKTYFSTNPKWEKVKKMVLLIDDIEFNVTDTHLEAMLLECELIKSYKPIFNSQMKNDRRYAYLKIADYNRYNSLKAVDLREENSYGPFRRKFLLEKIIDNFKNLYPILKTNDCYEFKYHLFPVEMDKVLFEQNKESLMSIFDNEANMNDFIGCLKNLMISESQKCNFEGASLYRDMIEHLNFLRKSLIKYNNLSHKNFVLKIPMGNNFIKLLYVSNGCIILKEKCPKNDVDIYNFIERGNELALVHKNVLDEKSFIDFRDILYYEIMNLSEEEVINL